MLRSEAITIIKRGLGFRQTQDSAIIAALKFAQRTVEGGRSLPTFLLVFDVAIPVVANSPSFVMPTGFLRLHDDYDMYYLNADGARVFIPRRNYTEGYQAYVASGEPSSGPVGTATGYPSVMVVQSGTQGMFIPTPTRSFTAYLTYYKADRVLDSEIENLWLANEPDFLIGLAGMNVAGDLRDQGALQRFSAMTNTAGKGHMGSIVDEELAGRSLVMGRNN